MPFVKDDPNINRAGRPRGTLSITSAIRRKLQEMPEGQDKTYLEFLVEKILKKAVIEGDQPTIKNIWNYIDGLPQESMDITTGGKPFPIIDIHAVSTNNSDKEDTEIEEKD